MKKIYVASPLGFSEAGRFFMYEKLIPIIENAGFVVLDPWKLTSPQLIEKVVDLPYGDKKRSEWEQLNRVIGENNEKAIVESEAILAVLDGTDVDSGTSAEIGYGAALGKTIIGYRGDFRLAADNEGSIVNLQVEYFIRKSGGQIVASIDELSKALGMIK